MNGMRRFLATTKDAVQATAQSYSANSAPAAGVVAPASPSEDLSFTPSPVSRNNSNGAPNWPPAANVIDTTTAKPSSPIPVKTPVTSPTYSNGSPGTTTAGLFFRKDPRSAKPVVTRKSTEDDRASSPSVRKPTPPPPFVPPSKSPPPTLTSPSPSFVPREPSPRALPPVVQSATASGSRSTPSPSVPRSRAKPSLNTNDPSWGSASAQINTRDELLISLLASQAAIDSKECEVLSAEEVDDLKKEQTLLKTRVTALQRKRNLETKIRDAALSLQALHPNRSSQSTDQLDNANRKVATAEHELSCATYRAAEVQRKLLEHRAGVLSHSMRALEKRISVGSSTGVDTDDSESSVGANGSPTSTTATSIASNPTSRSAPGKFEGAHLFAGHAEAVLPSHSSVISKAQLQALEDKLKAVEKELTVAKRKETELGRDLKMLEMEKTEVEFNLGQELQSAEETIQALNVELDTISEKEDQIRRLEQEKAEWEQEREELESSRRGDPLRRVEELEAFHAEEQLEWETMRGEMQETHAVEIAGLRAELEMANMGGGSASKEAEDELQVSRELLRDVLRAHRIVLPLRATSLSVLVSTLGGHLESMQKKLEDQDTTIGEWELERSHLEDDARVAQDQATVAGRDLEMARKELDQAKNDIRRLEMRAKTQGSTDSFLKSPSPDSAAMFQLRSIWGALPSVEARSAKLPRGGRSPAGLPRKEGAEQLSISDLDVKSLKQLYDPARGGYTTPVVQGEFSLDDFINRVQALLIDDRLILERLIRFAQAHELLKNNAERAQKIAVESSVALETYQKQVRTLEERNLVLTQKQMATLDEVIQLQNGIELALKQKRALETKLMDTELSLKELTEKNNTLNSRALVLTAEAAEASTNTEELRKLEAERADLKVSLARAEDEVDAMRNAEQSQRIALLDELNSMQKENENLRAQLRTLQRK